LKKTFLILTLTLILISNTSFSQYKTQTEQLPFLSLNQRSTFNKPGVDVSSGASMGFNMGVASIESEVGFAIGAFAELKSRGISFLPQTNYWNVKKQTNFEIAGLVRFYLTKKALMPYIDGGLGINFYNSQESNVTKLGIIAGGGVELTNLGTSFNLLFDGKYKLIINDKANLSGVIFTAGLKFPLK